MIQSLPLTGLEESEFTEITPRIKKIAQRIVSDKSYNNQSIPEGVTSYLEKNLEDSQVPSRVEFRKRTADQILKSKYSNGCTDRAIAYLTLLRALQTPALYVETIKESALKERHKPWFSGHVFTDVLMSHIWVPREPRTRTVLINYNLLGKRYIPFGKGIDFTHLYLIDSKSDLFFDNPVRNQLPDDAEQIARKFYDWRPKR